ncbi:hypothetical protein B7463_g5478, partial [Scytalidium lignicola]
MASRVTTDSVSTVCNSISSMMPFLYQTKTLASISWTTTNAIRRSPLRIIRSSRSFTVSSKNQAESTSPPESTRQSKISTRDDSRRDDYRPLVRTVLTKAKYDRGREDVPWEYVPASKDQSYSLENSRQNTGLHEAGEQDDVDFAYSKSTGAATEDEDILGYLDEMGEVISSDLEPTKARESTITVSERHAFERIFADIFARSKSRERDGNIPDGHEESTTTTTAGRQDPKTKLNNIISGALRRPKSSEVLKQMKAAVEKYPPALRPAAARAMGLDAEEAGLTETEEEIRESVDPDHLEHLREPERARVEALMRAVETDFELWEVMESEVFSLVTKMGVDDVPKSSTSKRKLKNKKKLASQPAASKIPDGVSPLTLYGPLYPSHLLLGLRLLDRSFSQPSPLALSLLPRIKSLGLISHILGASTAFYNELLRIYWHRHDDFRGIIHLLEEMEQNGLEFDEETAEVISDIQKMQTGILQGRKGDTLQTLWRLPEFSVQQFKPWRRRIEEAIEEKA